MSALTESLGGKTVISRRIAEHSRFVSPRPKRARAQGSLINCRQVDLATGVSEIAIKNIERGATDPMASTLDAIQAAFDKAGVVFLDAGDTRDGGLGVRFKGKRRG
jgi:hypothetical protein